MCKTIYQFTGITKSYCIIWLFQLTMFCCNFMISSSCLLDLRFHHGLIIFYSVQEKIPFKDSSRFIFNYSLQSFWWWTLMFMFSQFSKVECIWLWYQSFVDYPLKRLMRWQIKQRNKKGLISRQSHEPWASHKCYYSGRNKQHENWILSTLFYCQEHANVVSCCYDCKWYW